MLQRKGAKPAAASELHGIHGHGPWPKLSQQSRFGKDVLVSTSGSGRVELGLLPSGRLVAIAALGVLTLYLVFLCAG